jgi:hypothetical protein
MDKIISLLDTNWKTLEETGTSLDVVAKRGRKELNSYYPVYNQLLS